MYITTVEFIFKLITMSQHTQLSQDFGSPAQLTSPVGFQSTRGSQRKSPAKVLQRLQSQRTEDEYDLARCGMIYGSASLLSHDADTADSDSPVMDSFQQQNGNSEWLKTLTNFSLAEFDHLWAVVEQDVISTWIVGRGRKHATKPKDAFMMALCVLKHYDTWSKHALDFGMKTSSFEKTITKVSLLCVCHLYDLT